MTASTSAATAARYAAIGSLPPEEGRAMFDAAARKWMGLSGDEFIRRWDAGEYAGIADKDGYRHIMDLAGLISFGRQDP